MERNKKLLYVHGFASSGSSGTVMTLRRYLTGWRVIAPDLPVDPFEALELLRKMVDEEQPDIVVGTSMGGMYTQQLWGVPRIVVNPSFEMSRSLLFGKMGRNKYMSKRKDGATEFRIDKAVVERFNNYRPYITAGGSPMVNLTVKKQKQLLLKKFDFMVEVGMGCDFYLPFFKLIPEVKFAFSLLDVLEKERKALLDSNLMKFTLSVDGVTSKMIIISFYFE